MLCTSQNTLSCYEFKFSLHFLYIIKIRVLLAFSPALWCPLEMQDKLHLGPILEHAGRISELQYMLLDHSTHQPNSPSSDFTETNPIIYISGFRIVPCRSPRDYDQLSGVHRYISVMATFDVYLFFKLRE
jgi:hypothetical protein